MLQMEGAMAQHVREHEQGWVIEGANGLCGPFQTKEEAERFEDEMMAEAWPISSTDCKICGTPGSFHCLRCDSMFCDKHQHQHSTPRGAPPSDEIPPGLRNLIAVLALIGIGVVLGWIFEWLR